LQEQINGAFKGNPQLTLTNILNGTFRFQDGKSLSPMAADLAIAYGLRNYGAHNVSSMPIIWHSFTDIRQRLLNLLFVTVEILQ
jgi:hypothetical protein